MNTKHITQFPPNIESLLFVQFKQKIWYISSSIAQFVKYLNTLLQHVSSKKYQDLSFGIIFFSHSAKQHIHNQEPLLQFYSLLIEKKKINNTKAISSSHIRFTTISAGRWQEGWHKGAEVEREIKLNIILKSNW